MRSDVRYQSLEASLMPAWPQLASLDLQKLSRRRWQRSPTPTRSSTPKKPTNWGWQVPIHAETSRARPTRTAKPRISKGTGRQKRACFMLSGLPLWEHSSLCSTHTLKSQCPRKAHLLWFSAFEKFSKGSLFPVHLSRPGMVRHATRYPATPTYFKIPKHYRNSKRSILGTGETTKTCDQKAWKGLKDWAKPMQKLSLDTVSDPIEFGWDPLPGLVDLLRDFRPKGKKSSPNT